MIKEDNTSVRLTVSLHVGLFRVLRILGYVVTWGTYRLRVPGGSHPGARLSKETHAWQDNQKVQARFMYVPLLNNSSAGRQIV